MKDRVIDSTLQKSSVDGSKLRNVEMPPLINQFPFPSQQHYTQQSLRDQNNNCFPMNASLNFMTESMDARRNNRFPLPKPSTVGTPSSHFPPPLLPSQCLKRLSSKPGTRVNFQLQEVLEEEGEEEAQAAEADSTTNDNGSHRAPSQPPAERRWSPVVWSKNQTNVDTSRVSSTPRLPERKLSGDDLETMKQICSMMTEDMEKNLSLKSGSDHSASGGLSLPRNDSNNGNQVHNQQGSDQQQQHPNQHNKKEQPKQEPREARRRRNARAA